MLNRNVNSFQLKFQENLPKLINFTMKEFNVDILQSETVREEI